MSTGALTLAATGATMFTLAAAHANADTLAFVRLALCGAALALATATDLAEHRIPDPIVLPAAAACTVLTVADGHGPGVPWTFALVALLLMLSLTRPAALGMGDVKLALLIAAGVDGRAPTAFALGLLLAACGGLTLLILRGRAAWRRSLPLAPFLATGTLAALLL